MAASQLFPHLRNPNQQVVRPAVMVVISRTDLKRHVVWNERLHALLRHEEVFERGLLLELVSVLHRLTRLSADVADEDGLARHAGGFSERPLKIGLVGKVVNDREHDHIIVRVVGEGQIVGAGNGYGVAEDSYVRGDQRGRQLGAGVGLHV